MLARVILSKASQSQNHRTEQATHEARSGLHLQTAGFRRCDLGIRFLPCKHFVTSGRSWTGLPTGVRHVRTAWYYSNWRDRCAYAGFYCLYAWDGYIYSYPYDDRPSAYAYSARRHRYRH